MARTRLHVKDAIGRRWQLAPFRSTTICPSVSSLNIQAATTPSTAGDDTPRTLWFDGTFVAVLLEHTAAASHLVAPEQAVIIPVSDKYLDYAQKWPPSSPGGHPRRNRRRNETLGRKIRDNQLKRIPYMLIVGEKKLKTEKFCKKTGRR